MSRLHSATYVIPTRRPWWQRAARAIELAWLRHRLQCVIDERESYLAAGMALGPKYLENCAKQIADFRQRLALLEINS